MFLVPLETTRTTGETHERALCNGDGPTRIFEDERVDGLAIPAFAVLDVEHGMEIEIMALASAQANAAQPLGDMGRAGRAR